MNILDGIEIAENKFEKFQVERRKKEIIVDLKEFKKAIPNKTRVYSKKDGYGTFLGFNNDLFVGIEIRFDKYYNITICYPRNIKIV